MFNTTPTRVQPVYIFIYFMKILSVSSILIYHIIIFVLTLFLTSYFYQQSIQSLPGRNYSQKAPFLHHIYCKFYYCIFLQFISLRCTNKVLSIYVCFQHHCRKCGSVVCGPCSSKRYLLRGQSDKPLRVCLQCFDELNRERARPQAQVPPVTTPPGTLLLHFFIPFS